MFSLYRSFQSLERTFALLARPTPVERTLSPERKASRRFLFAVKVLLAKSYVYHPNFCTIFRTHINDEIYRCLYSHKVHLLFV